MSKTICNCLWGYGQVGITSILLSQCFSSSEIAPFTESIVLYISSTWVGGIQSIFRAIRLFLLQDLTSVVELGAGPAYSIFFVQYRLLIVMFFVITFAIMTLTPSTHGISLAFGAEVTYRREVLAVGDPCNDHSEKATEENIKRMMSSIHYSRSSHESRS